MFIKTMTGVLGYVNRYRDKNKALFPLIFVSMNIEHSSLVHFLCSFGIRWIAGSNAVESISLVCFSTSPNRRAERGERKYAKSSHTS